MIDLTLPGAPLEGHIYLNDPTGETITYYKKTKTAYSAKPSGETQKFINPDALLTYLAALPSALKSANSLSVTEMASIDDIAKSYGLSSKIDYIGPKTTGTPFMFIVDKQGQGRFTIRKLANKFFLYKIVYKPNVVKGTPESVVHQGDWNTLIKELHVQFATLSQPTMTKADPDKNKLSISEMQAIDKLAKKYMFGMKQSVIDPNQVPYLSLQNNMGSNVYAVRKLESMYEILNIINNKNWEKLEIEPTFAEMLLKLNKLFENYMTVPSEKMDVFSSQEITNIGKIASDNHFLTNSKVMELEPDKHKVAAVQLLTPDGEVHWITFKDGNKYKIYKVFGTTWDLYSDTEFSQAFLDKLALHLHKQIPAAGIPEHNGITPEEYQTIKKVVDTYGETFWASYIESSYGQTAYVEVVSKPDPNHPGTIIFSVGALGNYYQINDENNKPKENSPTFNGIIARIHDRLSAKAGQVEISPKTLDEIINLVNSAGFAFVGGGFLGAEPYSFGKGTEVINVEQTGAVYYSNEGVMGPIYTKNPNEFIHWFKNTYLAGKVPDTAEKFADNILKLLNNAGFLNKSKFTIIPHEKINAIKLLRQYILQVTGGPCGLKKTKWAIENLSKFLDHIKTHGLPNMDGTALDLPDQFAAPEPHEGTSDKFLQEEQAEISKIISNYAPSITYQPTGDAIVIWVGNHITSYKVAKENDVYRVYTDKEGEWAIQNQTSVFHDFKYYLTELLDHIAKALANSKLDQPLAMTEPSALSPDMLSPSEVAELKKLIKKFKLPVATSYDKKLMEAKEKKPKENNAYSVTVADDPHKVYIKITKKDGEYVFAKGLSDAYFPLKTFDAFSDLLYYTDFFFNSYIKAPEPVVIEKIPDDEVKQIKELVKKYKVKGKVRRKYMSSQGQGKVPYVIIELDDIGMKDYVLGKTGKGVYKLFQITHDGEWENLAITDSWEGMYNIVSKVLNDEPLPADAEKYNPPVFTPDEFEWLETFMKTHKPQVLVKGFPNGVVGGYDPTNQVNGADNPLFVIRFAHDNPQNARILQVYTKDSGGEYEEYPFAVFEAMAHFIVQNIEVVTQLLKGEVSAEGKLGAAITNAGFEYKDHKEVALDHGGSKYASIYENSSNERLYLYVDGSSRIWYKNSADGETYKEEFANIEELTSWIETIYGGKSSFELKEMKEHLAHLGFATDSKSDKWSTVWTKTFGPDHQPSQDIVELHPDGASKVIPSPLSGDVPNKSSPFFFNTWFALHKYLSEKYIKGEDWADAYFKKIMKEGEFKKKNDENTEMGYLYQSAKLFVVPFPSGGIMRTMLGVEPKFLFSFESTYDLAKRIELFLDSNVPNNPVGWSTGYSELDNLIGDAGFKFQGEEDVTDHGPKLVFLDGGGIKLNYYLNDEGSSIQFPAPTPIEQKGIGFTTVEDLTTHLKKYVEKPNVGVQPPKTKTPAADAAAEESVMKYDVDAQILITQDLAGLAPQEKIESIHFQYNSNALGTGEIRVITKNILQFAIGKKYIGSELRWYVRQKVADSYAGLYTTYDFKEKGVMVSWIKEHISNLLSFKSIYGGTPSVPPPHAHPPVSDFGSMYHQSPVMEALLHNAGFHQEMNSLGILWEHKSDLQMQIFENGFVWGTGKGMKEVSIGKPYHGDIIQKMCLKIKPDMSSDHVDQIITAAFKTREEEMFEELVKMAADQEGSKNVEIDKALSTKNFGWYDEEHCWVNEDLLQVVVANPKDSVQVLFRFWWIQNKKIHGGTSLTVQELLQWVGPGGKIEHQKAEATDKETGGQFVPSGETYKAHDIAGNADLIWLNEHDMALLQSLGFVPSPSENQYYKNSAGNIVKFMDTGKAEYIDFSGHPDQPGSGEVIEFDTIPHALKFMVAKHTTFPFSVQNYKDDDGENIYEIQLNPHDNALMEQLGFIWDEGAKKYVKSIGPDDNPKLQEAKKKKKEPPLDSDNFVNAQEPDDFANAEEPDDYYEIFTAYDTGNAIWQSVKGDGPKEQIMNEEQGKIPDMLQFVWKRWQHELADTLKSVKGMPAEPPDSEKKNNLMGVSTGKPKKTYPLDPKNYPTAPDWDKNFSSPGNAIKLNDDDHKAVLATGFKFLTPGNIYKNFKTKDQFRIFSNGFAWYKLTGTGEGMDNNLGHFFDMLKSKYGQLEWGFQSISGHEIVQIKDKFDILGFKAVEHPEAADDLYFERYPTDGKSSANVKEVVVVFPNHTLNFYLYDTTSTDRLLGVSEFESLSYGIHALEDFKHLIKLHLAHDLEPELTSHGFAYVPDKLRYEHVLGNGGLKIYINFFATGKAQAQLMEPDSSTSDGFEEVKEKTFVSFYDAILWAAHKNFEIQPQPVTSVDVKKVMKDLGLENEGYLSQNVMTFKDNKVKIINVDLKSGKVDYNFLYVANEETGELLWGKTIFSKWSEFMGFLVGKAQVKPTVGELTYTPHPTTKGVPKIPPPGQGPPIKGKIQGKAKAPTMPFSGFDYEGWAKDKPYNPTATIKLVPDDDMMLQKLNWAAVQSGDGVYYYTHHKTGDKVYFFVDGHAQIIPKVGNPITLSKVKMALAMLWAQHYHDTGMGLPPMPDVPIMPYDPKSKVGEELMKLGFQESATGGDELEFEKETPGVNYHVTWDTNEDTIEFKAITTETMEVEEGWTLGTSQGMKELKEMFAGLPPEKKFNVIVKLNELGFYKIDGDDEEEEVRFEKKTSELKHIVVWNENNNILEYTASKIDDPSVVTGAWAEDVNTGLEMLEHIFTPKLTEAGFVTAKMEELGFHIFGTPIKNEITYERTTPKFHYLVGYKIAEKTMHFLKSDANITKTGQQIVEQWTLNVSDALGKLENLFAFGSLGTVQSKKKSC